MLRIESLVYVLVLVWVSLFIGLRSNTVRFVLKLPPKQNEVPEPIEEPVNPPEPSILIFPESALAHKLLDGLHGIEIGGSAHNPFGLKALNVDFTDDETTEFKKDEIKLCGKALKVDVVASGDDLPFKDNTVDFVISSHVIEHFYDPIKTVKEWLRVVKPEGYVYIIAPHKERTYDKERPRTTLAEIIDRHEHPNPPEIDDHHHYSVWITQDFVDICNHYQWKIMEVQDIDDKVTNGFTIVIQK